MNPFLKSSEPDLKKLFKLVSTTHKNVLYITYQMDKIRRDIDAMKTDKGLQTQVDSYFSEKAIETQIVHPEDETESV